MSTCSGRCHHPAIEIIVNTNDIELLENASIPKHNFHKLNNIEINEKLSTQNWTEIMHQSDIDEAVNDFYKIVNNCIGLVPQSVSKSKNKYPNWYSAYLISLIQDNQLNKIKLQFNKSKNINDYVTFSKYRHLVKYEISACHKRHLTPIEEQNKFKSKAFFSYTKSTLLNLLEYVRYLSG